jgi:L-alanine-DL-glutamate epimerase-like enolase superfamily enzyme
MIAFAFGSGVGCRITMRITRVTITVVEIPQVPPVAPYRSRIRTSSTTRSAISCLETDAGLVGWGEHNVNFLDGMSPHADC